MSRSNSKLRSVTWTGRPLKFIDLFAGLGGFHLALSSFGFKGVFACELDETLRDVYVKNFGLKPDGDIRDVKLRVIPQHDILCAGFPCQPFSKAGRQEGFACPQWGDLFDHVLRIVKHHRPKHLLLENVPNLERHDDGRTWKSIESRLRTLGYDVRHKRLSPHRFGVPQIRERLLIVASLSSLERFEWPTEHAAEGSIVSILDSNPPDARPISSQVEECLDVWQEFLRSFPKNEELPSFPIWSMEFGATYPFERATPYSLGEYRLRPYRGAHGVKLAQIAAGDRMNVLPAYACTEELRFPKWKVNFIRQNRELYKRNRKWIDKWLPRIEEFPPSLQKLEWNCKGEKRDIWRYIIQFRASGVRVKRPTYSPSLVSMTTTQVPIIAWEGRYITPRECARLQSLDLAHLPEAPTQAYRALGNAVNVHVVRLVLDSLLRAVAPERLHEISA